MHNLDIRFKNKARQHVTVRHRWSPGTCTGAIDLAGNRSDISWVRMKYSPIRHGGQPPLVRVMAR